MNEWTDEWMKMFHSNEYVPVKGIFISIQFSYTFIYTLYPFICSHSFGLGLRQATNRKCCMKQQQFKWKVPNEIQYMYVFKCMYVCVCVFE